MSGSIESIEVSADLLNQLDCEAAARAVLCCSTNDASHVMLLLPVIIEKHSNNVLVVIDLCHFLLRVVGNTIHFIDSSFAGSWLTLLNKHDQNEEITKFGWAVLRNLALEVANCAIFATTDLLRTILSFLYIRYTNPVPIIEQLFAFICNVTSASEIFKRVLLTGENSQFCSKLSQIMDLHIQYNTPCILKLICGVIRNISNIEGDEKIFETLAKSGLCSNLSKILMSFPLDDDVFNEACCATRSMIALKSGEVNRAFKDADIAVPLVSYLLKRQGVDDNCCKELTFQAFCIIYGIGTAEESGMLDGYITPEFYKALIDITQILITHTPGIAGNLPEPFLIATQFCELLRHLNSNRQKNALDDAKFVVPLRRFFIEYQVAKIIVDMMRRFVATDSFIEQACLTVRNLTHLNVDINAEFCKAGISDVFSSILSAHSTMLSIVEQVLICICNMSKFEVASDSFASDTSLLISHVLTTCRQHLQTEIVAKLGCYIFINLALWKNCKLYILKQGAVHFITIIFAAYTGIRILKSSDGDGDCDGGSTRISSRAGQDVAMMALPQSEEIGSLAISALGNLLSAFETDGNDCCLTVEVDGPVDHEEDEIIFLFNSVISQILESSPSCVSNSIVMKSLMLTVSTSIGSRRLLLAKCPQLCKSVIKVCHASRLDSNPKCVHINNPEVAEMLALFVRNITAGDGEDGKNLMTNAGACELIVEILGMHKNRPEVIEQCVSAIRNIMFNSSVDGISCARMVDKGICTVIFDVLKAAIHNHHPIATITSILAALCGLAKHSGFSTKCNFTNAGSVIAHALLENLLRKEAVMFSLLTLRNLIISSSSKSAKLLLGNNETCEVLIECCRAHSEDAKVIEQCCHVLRNLVFDVPANMITLHNLGMCDIIMNIYNLHGQEFEVLEQVCATVSNITCNGPSKDFLIKNGLCDKIVSIMRANIRNPSTVEHCVWVVRNLSHDSDFACARFGELGACELVCSAFEVHAEATGTLAEQLCQVVRNLAHGSAANSRRFGTLGIANHLYQVICKHFSSDSVCSHCLLSVWNLSIDVDNRTAFGASKLIFAISALILAYDRHFDRLKQQSLQHQLQQPDSVQADSSSPNHKDPTLSSLMRRVYLALVHDSENNKIRFYECICRLKALSVLYFGAIDVQFACAFEIDHIFNFMRSEDHQDIDEYLRFIIEEED